MSACVFIMCVFGLVYFYHIDAKILLLRLLSHIYIVICCILIYLQYLFLYFIIRVLLFVMLLSVVVALFKLFIHFHTQHNFGCFFFGFKEIHFVVSFAMFMMATTGKKMDGYGRRTVVLVLYVERMPEISFGMCSLFLS